MAGIYRYLIGSLLVLSLGINHMAWPPPRAEAQELLPPGGTNSSPEFLPGTLPAPGAGLPEMLPNPGQPNDQEQVVDVRVVGNKDVSLDVIVPLIQTRVGRPLDKRIVQEDIRRLNRTRKFITVASEYLRAGPGVIVIYRVVERPVIHEINYLGNRKISLRAITKQTELEVGQPLDPYTVEEAKRKLEEFYKTRGFNHVRIEIISGNKPDDRKVEFIINEGPPQKIKKIIFKGNKIATGGRLKTQIQSRTPILWLFKGYVDRQQIDADVDRLTAYYRGLGFFRARISRELKFNEEGDWLTLTFIIDEGPRYKVRDVSFIGHTKFRSGDLKSVTELTSTEFFDQGAMNEDVRKLKEIYGSYGYIFADIKAEPRFLEEPGTLDLVYNIDEGHRYRVGKIEVEISGEYPHTSHRVVLNRLSLRPGDIIDLRELQASERRLKASGLFENDPSKGSSPRIVVKPLDEEDGAGDISNFRGQSPDPGQNQYQRRGRVVDVTHLMQRQQTAQPAEQPSLGPSQDRLLTVRARVDWRDLPSKRPLVQRVADALTFRKPAAGAGAAGAQAASADRRPLNYRGQSPQTPEGGYNSTLDRPVVVQQSGFQPFGGRGNANPQPNPASPRVGAAFGATNYPTTNNPVNNYTGNSTGNSISNSIGGAGAVQRPITVNPGGPTQPGTANYLQPGGATPVNPLPPGGGRPIFGAPPPPPGTGLDPGSPSDQDFYNFDQEPDREAILIPQVTETRTGRFSVGAGINSDAGVVGTIVLEEQNFDIWRFPRSWEEIRNGTAWRGGGQQFRIEAVPGSQFQRYTLSFSEPYLLDTPISFGLSAFLFDRRYDEWDEQRLGGQLSLGYQLRPDLSATVSLRAENVDISNPAFPTPPQLAAVLGNNDLFTTQLALTHDTRDSTFLPTEGHLLQFQVEQAFGEFDFPRAEVDARRYFLIHQRPDTSGRHVLSLRGRVGATGSQTPVFENYFAGGFTTLRGFDFRGAQPRVAGVSVGGRFMTLGSVEYLFPLTADDGIRMVVFCDFGTVEESVKFEKSDVRVAPGVGLRIAVPGMGPAPIALDFAWAVEEETGDEKRVFSFFVGLLR